MSIALGYIIISYASVLPNLFISADHQTAREKMQQWTDDPKVREALISWDDQHLRGAIQKHFH